MSRQLSTTEIDGGLLITLPIAGKQVPWAKIGSQFVIAASSAGTAVMRISLLAQIRNSFPGWHSVISEQLWIAIGFDLLWAIAFGLLAAHSLVMYRSWGQVPRTLNITRDGATLSWLGFRRMRERTWKPAEVKSIDIKKVKDALTRKRLYRVRIIFRTKWPRVVVLSTKDSLLAEQIRDRLCTILA